MTVPTQDIHVQTSDTLKSTTPDTIGSTSAALINHSITKAVTSHIHLSLPRPFTSDLKLISFTNPFLRSHS